MENTSKVTLDDIAERVGVSVAAVSQALSGKGRISQETKERILEVVEELSYQPDRYAQNLAQRSRMQAQGKPRKKNLEKYMPPPGIMSFYHIPELAENLMLEIRQRVEQGYDAAHLQHSIEEFSKLSKKKLYDIYRQVLATPQRPDYPYREPDSLAEIIQQRPENPRETSISLTAQDLSNRISGAWQGRIIGSVLARPIEPGLSKKRVIEFLKIARSYPLADYIPQIFPHPDGYRQRPDAAYCYRGEIHGAPFDDDLDGTLLALSILESFGVQFTTVDVATAWLEHLTFFHTHNTDRTVYRNLVWNVSPQDAATFVNPEAEFIGARMRADLYGYICPGRPALASSLAYQDASLSHTRNGIYSAMFMAAMLAWAYVSDDPSELVAAGLSKIPKNSRLAEGLRFVLTLHQEVEDWEIAYEQLLLKYGDYLPIHAIPNTLWVALALLYGAGNFEQSLSIAVACGFDADANAASTGSILGLLHGSRGISPHWVHPLENTVHNSLAQFPETSISSIAGRMTALAQKILSNHFEPAS